MTREAKIENLIYLVIAGVALAATVIGEIVHSHASDGAFHFSEVLGVWLRKLPFFLLFALHNYLLFPLFLGGRRKLYVALVVLALALFGGYLAFLRPLPEKKFPAMADMEAPGVPPSHGIAPDGPGEAIHDVPPKPKGGFFGGHPVHHPEDKIPYRPIPPSILLFLLGLGMLAFNIAMKVYFKSLSDARRVQELEKENLQDQLSYLRYQINPHFFMNTLNNIHALVDIDPEKAKESIVELSKLMRYILYEGSKPVIPLEREVDFLKQYVSLMRMRYADSIDIQVSLPEAVPGAEVPPLVFVSFVENAFKHGVSYDKPSFIHVAMKVDGGRLLFKCRNSRFADIDKSGGVGMDNVRKRLDLMYGSDYVMDIEQQRDYYNILVSIPLTYEKSDSGR